MILFTLVYKIYITSGNTYVPKTVSGPSPERASTKPAAVIATTSVEKSGLPTAMSTIPWHSSSAGASSSSAGVGLRVGLSDGIRVGLRVGLRDGLSVGLPVGFKVDVK